MYNVSRSTLSKSLSWLGSDWGLGKSQSDNMLVFSIFSFLSVFVPSQSSLDQSNSWGEGCRAPCLQNEHDSLNLLHALTGNGALISVSMASRCHFCLWGIKSFCFYRVLPISTWPPGSHLASSSLSWVSWCLGRGRELKHVALFHGNTVSFLLSSW